jgi:hypothetical protein
LEYSDFCCDNRSPDGRDAQAGLTGLMVYQRHVGRFLIFPVGGVWFRNTIIVLIHYHHKLLEKERTEQRKVRAK